MNKYEIMLLCAAEEAEYKKVIDFFKKTFKSIIKEDLIGIRELAYPINKKTKGYYHLYIVESDNDALEKLQYELKINKSLYRTLVINLNKEFRDPEKYIQGKLKTKPDKDASKYSYPYYKNSRRSFDKKSDSFNKNDLKNKDSSDESKSKKPNSDKTLYEEVNKSNFNKKEK